MFEDWAAIVLDVPPAPVDIEDLRDFVQHHADHCAFVDDRIRHVTFHARKPVVDGALVLHAPSLADAVARASQEETPPFGWDPVFAGRFSPLTTWFESLPFARLDGITFVTQTADIPDHLDVFGDHSAVTYYEAHRAVEPAFYRAVFTRDHDEEVRSGSFYVTETFGGPRRFVAFPAGRNLAAVSTSTVYHGAVHHPGRFKTTAAVYGALDDDRHLELLGRSLARLPRAAIRLTRPGPVDGPGARRPYRPPHE